jgi:hypothetical protein
MEGVKETKPQETNPALGELSLGFSIFQAPQISIAARYDFYAGSRSKGIVNLTQRTAKSENPGLSVVANFLSPS